jgi:squalene-hopene/tetraprenyl-beta-curcumene cyclase
LRNAWRPQQSFFNQRGYLVKHRLLLIAALLVLATSAAGFWSQPAFAGPDDKSLVQSAARWNRTAAAQYLDSREVWWQHWSRAQRDHQTVCISCHTVVPYALARPLLRGQSDEPDFAPPERVMYDDVAKRVTLWQDVEPFYKDGKAGPTKSIESRSTEAVLNSLILASYDSRKGRLSELTKSAFQDAWALQRHSGQNAGAWIWLNFHNGPWESNVSEYWGATMAALAVGIAPGHYLRTPSIQGNLAEMRVYLRQNYGSQPLVNRISLLWASAEFPGLITRRDRAVLVRAILEKQRADGGWSLTDLGSWKRRDNTPLVTKSDGYATGLTVLALELTGRSHSPQVKRGRAWLLRNQDSSEGFWPAWSLNKYHDPASDTGRFMDDAATGFAVLALEENHPQDAGDPNDLK